MSILLRKKTVLKISLRKNYFLYSFCFSFMIGFYKIDTTIDADAVKNLVVDAIADAVNLLRLTFYKHLPQ